MITYRQATFEDVDAIAAVEAASWPSSLAASREAINERVAAFAAGQWVAILNDRIVGAASAQRISSAQLQSSAVDLSGRHRQWFVSKYAFTRRNDLPVGWCGRCAGRSRDGLRS